MFRLIIKNGKVLCGDFKFRHTDIKINNGIISEIGDGLSSDEVFDAAGDYVLPGLIEEHFHGANGFQTLGGTAEDLKRIAEFEATDGITTIVPTLSSYPDDTVFKCIDSMKEAMKSDVNGARILGLHLEGPFLCPNKRGAHKENNLKKPTVERMKKFLDSADGAVKIVTIAPELDDNFEVIKYAVSRGVVVEIGHSEATYETALGAIDAGATVSTHTFNAMAPLNHRNPGILGAVLTDDRVHCEVMGDFGHVAPAIVKLIYKAKGDRLVNFVSDSMLAAGLPDGEYIAEEDGGVNIVTNGLSRLADGTINGSASTLLKGVQNAVKIDIPLESAVKMASYNPAVSLKIDHECGSIEIGKRADIFIAGEDLVPKAVFVKARRVK